MKRHLFIIEEREKTVDQTVLKQKINGYSSIKDSSEQSRVLCNRTKYTALK